MEPTKDEYTKIIMDLIYFDQRLEKIMAYCDHKQMRDAIDTLRWYRQFAKND